LLKDRTINHDLGRDRFKRHSIDQQKRGLGERSSELAVASGYRIGQGRARELSEWTARSVRGSGGMRRCLEALVAALPAEPSPEADGRSQAFRGRSYAACSAARIWRAWRLWGVWPPETIPGGVAPRPRTSSLPRFSLRVKPGHINLGGHEDKTVRR
jgi:hypothetical protein